MAHLLRRCVQEGVSCPPREPVLRAIDNIVNNCVGVCVFWGGRCSPGGQERGRCSPQRQAQSSSATNGAVYGPRRHHRLFGWMANCPASRRIDRAQLAPTLDTGPSRCASDGAEAGAFISVHFARCFVVPYRTSSTTHKHRPVGLARANEHVPPFATPYTVLPCTALLWTLGNERYMCVHLSRPGGLHTRM